MKTANIVICGAGIAGISTAYYLAVHHGIKEVLLVDERAPLTLTSDKSSECYRNWWPGPGNEMIALMNRSIDLMEALAEESGNIFHMNWRGYLYLTADRNRLPQFEKIAVDISLLGAGPLRIHRVDGNNPRYLPAPPNGFRDIPNGADLLLDPVLIQNYFPYLAENIVGALHVRRAGWFSAQQMGVYMLARARAHGVRSLNARISGVEITGNEIQAVKLSNGNSITTRNFVNAAGPFTAQIGKMMGIELPISNQLHLKAAFRDPLGVLPRKTPLLICNDPQILPWSSEERQWLADDADTRWLLEHLPPGAHTRPEGGEESEIILALWDYHAGRRSDNTTPQIPPPLDQIFPEIVLRGIASILPQFSEYFERVPRAMLDGGYYTHTPENRPLIGPLSVKGAYIVGALSGFGMMAACGAGELLAAYITKGKLPPYSQAFTLERYDDPSYQKLLENWENQGQL